MLDEPYLFKLKHGHDSIGIGFMTRLGPVIGTVISGATVDCGDISGWLPLDEAARILDGEGA